MKAADFIETLEQHPVIIAVRDRGMLAQAVTHSPSCVFLLAADLTHLDEDMSLLAAHHKHVFVHMDLVTGLGRDAAGIRYLARNWHPAGIISTHQNLLRAAQEEQLLTVQRVFLMDTYAMSSAVRLAQGARAELIEVMPGVLPRAIRQLREQLQQPIIAGGLITDKSEILQALNAGALAVSTTTAALWNA